MPGRWVGAGIKRTEDRRLLTGAGRFVADLRLPGMLSAAIVRSPHAHARIVAIDAAPALARRGVGAVGRIPMRMSPPAEVVECLQRPLALDRVRYVGEPVAIVVAEDRYRAEDAAELVKMELEPLPVVTDARQALAPGAPVFHEALGRNLSHPVVPRPEPLGCHRVRVSPLHLVGVRRSLVRRPRSGSRAGRPGKP